jgi:hypothetical protein
MTTQEINLRNGKVGIKIAFLKYFGAKTNVLWFELLRV